ncbi:MAG: sulfite exporter TauE/SafE family protein [Candidatus Bipolaricaulota bacterium]
MTFEPGLFAWLSAAGLGIGVLSSLLGVGGGIFIVPLLTLTSLVGTVQQAAGTSIATIVVTSISAAVAYALRRTISYRAGLSIVATSILGTWAGAKLTSVIDSRWLAVAFAAMLLYPIATMLRGKTTSEISITGARETRGTRWVVTGAAIGLVAGLASGLLGIGSGTIMVPSLILFLGLDIRPAIATSLFVMVPSSVVGALTHFAQGNVRLDLVLPLVVGTVVGAQFGPVISKRIPRRRLRQVFALVLLYAAVNMVIKAFR